MKENTINNYYPTGNKNIKRGDVYYVNFGEVRDAVGRELAKRRPVLIIQNNLGNLKSETTICLCLSTKCKGEVPYHVHYEDLSVVTRPSDICAEQIKTIDKCRLEEFLGNVGPVIMEEVDKALAVSLGMREVPAIIYEAKESVVQPDSVGQFMNEQFVFWKNLDFRITILEAEKMRLDEEIESILTYIELSNYNAPRGYKVYKVLRDKRGERKSILKDLTYLKKIKEQVNTDAMMVAFANASGNARDELKELEKIRFVPELMDVEE